MFTYFLTALLAATLVLFFLTRMTAERLIRQHHGQKTDFFRHYPVQSGDIVFLGDSITDGARWDDLFPGLPVKNRGINADTVSGVLDRMDEVLAGKPAAIFILIGTNDLPWYIQHDNENIMASYQGILERCRTESPETRVFVQSILPRTRGYAKRIQLLNQRLEDLARRCGSTYIDLYPHFSDSNGAMRAEISNDHLHLLGGGYAIWVSLLAPVIEGIPYRSTLASNA